MKMKITKKLIRVIIFNIAETILIFLIGFSLKLPINEIIGLMLVFVISRGCFGIVLHFKDWYRCLVWSLLILFSLFTILKVDLVVSILFTIFSAFIMTGKCRLNDIYLWSGKSSKYDALKDLIAISPTNNILLEHEEYWRKNHPMRYDIFRLYFRENKTYREIAELKNFEDNTIIKKECATIYSILEKPLNLPPI